MLWIDVKIANAKDGALNGPQFDPDMLSSCGQIYGTAKAPTESFMIPHQKRKKKKKRKLYDSSKKKEKRKKKKRKLFMTFLLNFYNEKNIQEFIFFCNKTKQMRQMVLLRDSF